MCRKTGTVPVPSASPEGRLTGDVAPPGSYQAGDRVWVYRASAWRTGVVMSASAGAVTVRYRTSAGRATGVDTVVGVDLAARNEPDPALDQPVTLPPAAT